MSGYPVQPDNVSYYRHAHKLICSFGYCSRVCDDIYRTQSPKAEFFTGDAIIW